MSGRATAGRRPGPEGSAGAARWRAAAALAAAGLALAPFGWLGAGHPETPTPPAGDPVDARTALREGNRRLRLGDAESAIAAWEAGWHGGGSGEEAALAYNLATTAHRLGRLPEAVVWYRRAEAAGGGDAWLAENLALARAELGAPALAPAGPLVRLAARPVMLPALAAGLSWLAAGMLAASLLARGRREPAASAASSSGGGATTAVRLRRAGLALGAAALAAWAAGAAVAAGAPRPAVLTAACPAAGGELPAGAEVWVRPAEDGGGWRIAAASPGTVCPPESVGLIE